MQIGVKERKIGDEKLRCEGNDFPLTINKPLPVVLIYTPGTKIVVSRMWNKSEYKTSYYDIWYAFGSNIKNYKSYRLISAPNVLLKNTFYILLD